MSRGKRINWCDGEKPETVNMSTRELESFAIGADSYYDVFPSPMHNEFDKMHYDTVEVYNDMGEIFAVAKKQSRNSWRVRTIIGT